VTDHYDAVVIGSGAGGGTLARTLATSGKRILLLERGNFLPRELSNWQPRQVLKGHERLVNSLSFSPDNRTLASGSSDGTVRLWDVESGEQRAAFDWQLGRVWTVAFAPDGMRAAAGGDKGKLILWDVDL
jgi:WD40 repeat protein